MCRCLAPKDKQANPHPYDQFADAPAPHAENTKTKTNTKRHLTESAFPNENESAIANLKLQQCK
jgi:hypothetical protein